MIYSIDITVPMNTPQTAKQRTNLKVVSGIIHQIDIQFPTGVAATTHVQISDGFSQLWPSNPAQDFVGDGYTISFKEEHEIKYVPFFLYVHTWNDSTTYDHTITVRLGILPPQAFISRMMPLFMDVLLKGGVV